MSQKFFENPCKNSSKMFESATEHDLPQTQKAKDEREEIKKKRRQNGFQFSKQTYLWISSQWYFDDFYFALMIVNSNDKS